MRTGQPASRPPTHGWILTLCASQQGAWRSLWTQGRSHPELPGPHTGPCGLHSISGPGRPHLPLSWNLVTTPPCIPLAARGGGGMRNARGPDTTLPALLIPTGLSGQGKPELKNQEKGKDGKLQGQQGSENQHEAKPQRRKHKRQE